jgi:hypothetical protein
MLEFERKAKPAIGLILGHEIRAVMGSVLDVYFFFVKFAQGQRENPAHQKEWQTLPLVVRKPSCVN